MDAHEPFDPLADLRASGLAVVLAGDRLIVRPASGLTEHLRALIRTRRASIVAALLSETLPDDRITCRACANLSGRQCLAARRREIVASPEYEPMRDIPRRCEGYVPRDQYQNASLEHEHIDGREP